MKKLWLMRGWRVSGPLDMGLAGWIVLVPTWLAMVQLQQNPVELLVLLGVVWVADSAAYFAGRRFGRHKLAPAISPGKTWEGVAGAVIGFNLTRRSTERPGSANECGHWRWIDCHQDPAYGASARWIAGSSPAMTNWEYSCSR